MRGSKNIFGTIWSQEIQDYVETQDINQAISQCEVRKADLEAQLTDCEAELADYVAIRDAE